MYGLLVLLAFCAMTLSARAAVPVAPSNCVATGITYYGGYGTPIHISWQDNSTDETQWFIYVSVNGRAYAQLGSAVTSSTTPTTGNTVMLAVSGSANTTYRFKVCAFSSSTGFSAASNEATVTPGIFTLTATPLQNQTSVLLSWPNVPNESGYQIQYAVQGASSYSVYGLVAADVTSCQVNLPASEATKTYLFLVRPYVGTYPTNYSVIGSSNQASAKIDYAVTMTSKPGESGTPGSPFSHTFTHDSALTVSSQTLTGIPAGLNFNSATGLLSGVFPALGVYTLNYTVHFASGNTLTQTFYIRVRTAAGAPAVGTVIPAWTGIAGTSRDTALGGTFTDAEAESAVRVSTNLGNMDIILFNTATPATVTNFMTYVNEGKYTDVDFHRAIAGFMAQSGGFKGAGTGSNFTSVVTHPPVVNEPGIGNERGTVSMAKLGGDPNSATSQFFVSVANNRGTYPNGLDYQNGGFTVFGRVAGNGMTVADAISNLPNGTYNLYLDGSATTTQFTNFPMNAATFPAAMDQTKLVRINSVTTIPTLSYTITGSTQPSIATATIINGQLHLVALAPGQTVITVTATDLDNLTTSQTVPVTISDTFTSWASRYTFPGGLNGASQNPDGDAWNNLQEYAFLGDPTLPSPTSQTVYSGIAGVAPAPRYLALTFPMRKFTSGLTYTVEAADGLTGPWTTVWSSPYGLSYIQVVGAMDQTDRVMVTIKDTVALGARQKHFMRIRINQD